MKIQLQQLKVLTRQSTELVKFSAGVTFIHGPVGTGKSTVARLIDYCFGGKLERTPAIQSEFIAVQLSCVIGKYNAQFERGTADTGSVRVTWDDGAGDMGSVGAPLDAGDDPIFAEEIFNLSDLIFHLAGVAPIKVRKSKRDPDSPLVRLSFRDLYWYCYLRQDKMDNSFFRLEDPFQRLKSMDAMRFVTGLYSDRLNLLEGELSRTMDDQRAKRAAVEQIRAFLRRFELGTEAQLLVQTQTLEGELTQAKAKRVSLERANTATTHTAEPMRVRLRELSDQIDRQRQAMRDLQERIEGQREVRSELVTAKLKAGRADAAASVLTGVEFAACPRCGATMGPDRFQNPETCCLCLSSLAGRVQTPAEEIESVRRDLNARIDELTDSIRRHERAWNGQQRELDRVISIKAALDVELASELAKYDSAYVTQVRAADRQVAALEERIASLRHLAKLPTSIQQLEKEAGDLQGSIDNLRSALVEERDRLQAASGSIKLIEDRFLAIMRDVGYPGVDGDDQVVISPKNWMPMIIHGEDRDVQWGFFDAGSGGKKTLFNVCYALAVHEIAFERGMPLPTLLVIDSPTKNISRDINAKLVANLYRRMYTFAQKARGVVQFVLIDSDLVRPSMAEVPFEDRTMVTGNKDHPPLISYYDGP